MHTGPCVIRATPVMGTMGIMQRAQRAEVMKGRVGKSTGKFMSTRSKEHR